MIQFNVMTGQLCIGPRLFSFVFGRDGYVDNAQGQEGDFKTPLGIYPARYGYYRADRLPTPKSRLTFHAITDADGWCDDSGDMAYNLPVKRPYPARHERLMREDCAYDIILVLGHNDDPIIAGKGSAVFLHICRIDQRPTAGCIAVTPDVMAALLPHLTPGGSIEITA